MGERYPPPPRAIVGVRMVKAETLTFLAWGEVCGSSSDDRLREERCFQEDRQMAECRKCGLPIGWRKLPNGKWCPQNLDGSDHWDICRETTRGSIKDAVLRESKNAQGERIVCAISNTGEKVVIQKTGKPIQGNAPICKCHYDVAPWEVCPNCENLNSP